MIVIKLISVNLPESYLNMLENLVVAGRFPNRSEAIRVSIRDLIKLEYLIDERIDGEKKSSIIESKVQNEVEENVFT
ncbi:hypothetical protein LCGC14_0530860 [marine sediment metagenome]|uniref:Ribbon-helix-helix protein CopG domain-containing protein n=1 Tax=marine sediment metagenome TaxID=412755 RepID=A0A0F9V3T0_9ZZZZ